MDESWMDEPGAFDIEESNRIITEREEKKKKGIVDEPKDEAWKTDEKAAEQREHEFLESIRKKHGDPEKL